MWFNTTEREREVPRRFDSHLRDKREILNVENFAKGVKIKTTIPQTIKWDSVQGMDADEDV